MTLNELEKINLTRTAIPNRIYSVLVDNAVKQWIGTNEHTLIEYKKIIKTTNSTTTTIIGSNSYFPSGW